jgi:hypothetical protein
MNITAKERREHKDGLEPQPKLDRRQGNDWQGNGDCAQSFIPLPNIPLPASGSVFVFSAFSAAKPFSP